VADVDGDHLRFEKAGSKSGAHGVIPLDPVSRSGGDRAGGEAA